MKRRSWVCWNEIRRLISVISRSGKRDVLGHLVASTDMRLAVMFGRLMRNGFSVDRTLSQQAREMG